MGEILPPFLTNLPCDLDRAPDSLQIVTVRCLLPVALTVQGPVTLVEVAESRRYFDLVI